MDRALYYNNTSNAINLDGWILKATDGSPSIDLTGSISAKSYYLLERTDDTSVPGITADMTYSGSLENGVENLQLLDSHGIVVDSVENVRAWYAGDNSTKATMERIDPKAIGDSSNWINSESNYDGGLGTPKALNSKTIQISVAINEIAWMGTSVSSSDEWIELINNTNQDIDLNGWVLKSKDNSPNIALNNTITANGFYLLERTDDSSVPSVKADQIYTGTLSNSGEELELIDNNGVVIDAVLSWHSGDSTNKATMVRVDSETDGNIESNWKTSDDDYGAGAGSPKAANEDDTPEPTKGGTSDDWFEVYFSDNLNTTMPSNGPKEMANALISAINSATSSIDFAIYGIGDAEEILNALTNAKSRGVVVRGVVDTSSSGEFSYQDTHRLEDIFSGSIVSDRHDSIMHNKFFIFDNKGVWTGSTNISGTGINAEYNSNCSIYIPNNTELALAYTDEFEEMYSGKFHDQKTDNTRHLFSELHDGSIIESYFAPTDDATTNAIVRAINSATSKIRIQVFYFTDSTIAQALIDAKNRGVDIQIIMDASGAENAYSKHKDLRNADIPVKVENWGGKEHMKTLVADDYMVVIGSQNWTASGSSSNDENTLYIENQVLAAKFDANFNAQWEFIPDAYLI